MQNVLNSIEEFEKVKKNQKTFVLYITDGTCNVGENLSPKLEKLLIDHFPKLKLYYSYVSNTPEISAQLSIFIIPTILVFLEGKLYIQKSRSFSLEELKQEIDKYYKLIF
jgi:thioredoxin 1